MTDPIRKAAEALLVDIESKQKGDCWFGGFTDYAEDTDQGDVEIEWPNLEISAAKLRAALTNKETE